MATNRSIAHYFNGPHWRSHSQFEASFLRCICYEVAQMSLKMTVPTTAWQLSWFSIVRLLVLISVALFSAKSRPRPLPPFIASRHPPTR